MTDAPARYPAMQPLGDAAFRIVFGEAMAPEIHDRVLSCTARLQRLLRGRAVEVVPGFCAVTIHVEPGADDLDALAEACLAEAQGLRPAGSRRGRTVRIPVHYGEESGPDLPDVAAFAGLSVAEAITRHAAVEYRVYLLGFSPGFPYMGPVPAPLRMARLPRPRLRVAAGSVGIAGAQTGIYPLESPGGWRLIGRTPLRLFRPEAPEPFLLRPGDRVRFVPIDRKEYARLAAQGAPAMGNRRGAIG